MGIPATRRFTSGSRFAFTPIPLGDVDRPAMEHLDAFQYQSDRPSWDLEKPAARIARRLSIEARAI